MPYVFVTTLIRLEIGPTIVGDEWSDPELMHFLGAELINEFGNNFKSYRTPFCPRIILNKLEERGYRVLTMTGVGQTCIWTCYKEEEQKNVTEDNTLKE